MVTAYTVRGKLAIPLCTDFLLKWYLFPTGSTLELVSPGGDAFLLKFYAGQMAICAAAYCCADRVFNDIDTGIAGALVRIRLAGAYDLTVTGFEPEAPLAYLVPEYFPFDCCF